MFHCFYVVKAQWRRGLGGKNHAQMAGFCQMHMGRAHYSAFRYFFHDFYWYRARAPLVDLWRTKGKLLLTKGKLLCEK